MPESDQASDFESVLEHYPVKLENFEGPLDLLLHLIRKHEVDIYDIPIVLITKQYLDYLDVMKELDLDLAGEFLVMAATLIYIKARTLVPRLEDETEEELDPEDPRDALVRRLIEHQRYKAAAELLHERETVRSAQWGLPDERLGDLAGEPFERELEVDLFGLLQAFQAVLQRARERPVFQLPSAEVSIETRTRQLMERLSGVDACNFDDLFDDDRSRGDLVTTFLALLEMIRLKMIRVFQSASFGPIRVYPRDRPDDAAGAVDADNDD
ncbi:MAG: segregation/condensation protein A [bacterium]|jgi:segregation and condensation protein A